MEKRVVIFLVLSLAVILGYDFLLKQLGLLPSSSSVQEPASQESVALESKPGSSPDKNEGATQANGPVPAPSIPMSPPAAPATSVLPTERTVTVETDLIRVG